MSETTPKDSLKDQLRKMLDEKRRASEQTTPETASIVKESVREVSTAQEAAIPVDVNMEQSVIPQRSEVVVENTAEDIPDQLIEEGIEAEHPPQKKNLKTLIILVVLLLTLAGLGFMLWANNPSADGTISPAVIETDSQLASNEQASQRANAPQPQAQEVPGANTQIPQIPQFTTPAAILGGGTQNTGVVAMKWVTINTLSQDLAGRVQVIINKLESGVQSLEPNEQADIRNAMATDLVFARWFNTFYGKTLKSH